MKLGGAVEAAHPQALTGLTSNTGMMRSTGGPASFHIGGRGQKFRNAQVPSTLQAQVMAERPSTRHGSNERSPGLARPITQGMSRRSKGLG